MTEEARVRYVNEVEAREISKNVGSIILWRPNGSLNSTQCLIIFEGQLRAESVSAG